MNGNSYDRGYTKLDLFIKGAEKCKKAGYLK